MQQLPPLLLGPPPPGWHGSRHPLQAQHAVPWLGRVAWDLQLPGLATTSSPRLAAQPAHPLGPEPRPTRCAERELPAPDAGRPGTGSSPRLRLQPRRWERPALGGQRAVRQE